MTGLPGSDGGQSELRASNRTARRVNDGTSFLRIWSISILGLSNGLTELVELTEDKSVRFGVGVALKA